MTNKDKQLLLQDLCARLPFGVRCSFGVDDAVYEVTGINPSACGASEIQATHVKSEINGDFTFSCCKPYLFPLSSMTEEQCYDFYCRFIENEIDYDDFKEFYFENNAWHKLLTSIDDCDSVVDWFNKNHFDYRNLINKNLARDATNLNIY